MLHIAKDKLLSTLGIKLPPVFAFLPCLASCPGLPPGQQGHHGPKYQLLHMELPYNLLNLVTSPELWDYIGNKVQENSGRQIRREMMGGQLGKKVGEKLGEKVGEKPGEKVGESLGEIHKLNLCPDPYHWFFPCILFHLYYWFHLN